MKKPSGYFPPIAVLPPHHAASATTFHPANIETENLSRRENMPVTAQKPGQVPALHKNGQAGDTGATEPAHMNRKGCHLPAGFPKPVQPQPPTAPPAERNKPFSTTRQAPLIHTCPGIRWIRLSFIRFCPHTGLFRENEPAVDITATGNHPLRGIHPHKSGMNGKHRRRQIDDNTIPDQCFHLLILLPFHKTRPRQTGDRAASACTDRHLHGFTGRHDHISRDTASRSADRRCIRPGSPAARPIGIGIDPHPAGKCSGRYTAAAGSPRAVIPASTPSAADTHDKKLGNPFRHHKRSGLGKKRHPVPDRHNLPVHISLDPPARDRPGTAGRRNRIGNNPVTFQRIRSGRLIDQMIEIPGQRHQREIEPNRPSSPARPSPFPHRPSMRYPTGFYPDRFPASGEPSPCPSPRLRATRPDTAADCPSPAGIPLSGWFRGLSSRPAIPLKVISSCPFSIKKDSASQEGSPVFPVFRAHTGATGKMYTTKKLRSA